MLDDEEFLDSTIDCLQLDQDQFLTTIDTCVKILGSLLSIEEGAKVAKKLNPKLYRLFALTNIGDLSLDNHVCWLLSNYVVCGSQFVEELLKIDLLTRVCTLANHSNLRVRAEALWILCNMISVATED